jgi:hypothetical protein
MNTYGRMTGLVKAVKKLMVGKKEVTLPMDDQRLNGLGLRNTRTRRELEAYVDILVSFQRAKNAVTFKAI